MMQYPAAGEYFSAVQHPERAFQRSSLQRAQLAKDPRLATPLLASGNSAIVFKAIVDGEPRALRFFIRDAVSSREHYTALQQYFREHDLTECVATSEWVDDAIEVNGRLWPMLQMQWAEGPTLDDYVDYLVEENDAAALASLAETWRSLVARLQTARFAHGDLQHGSLLVDTRGKLRLVDFDGSWIPPFAGQTPPSETGHPNYQRPNRPWGEWMDTFPGLLIYTSLVALSKDTSPWRELYDDDNLLFKRHDFDPPYKTPVWNRVTSIADEQLGRLLAELRRCCAPDWVAEGPLDELLGASTASESREPQLKVFLCHSSSDKDTVRRLYERLQSDNMQPWLDEEDILPGQEWDYEIRRAIRASDVVLVCLSRGSVDKVGYLEKEIQSVLDMAGEQPPGTIFLIPARLEHCDVPDRSRRWQWVDLFQESGYERLMRALRARSHVSRSK